ncbi:MAG: S-layer homology domain-containing protein [Clostridiales bacterium]|nr:S-layer homology domain-containing protein [Clostridiales bacterium]
MRKRTALALLLIAAMLLPTVAGAAIFQDVAPEVPHAQAIEELASLGVLGGFEDGSYRPEGNYTREQFAKILFVLLHGEDSAEPPAADPFPDVVRDRWSAGYIAWARSLGVVGGREDGLFYPTDGVTFAEVAKMLLTALGHETAGLAFPSGYTDLAGTLGLFEGLEGAQPNASAKRGAVAQMAHNALRAEAPRVGGPLLERVFGGGLHTGEARLILVTAVGGNNSGYTLTGLLQDGSSQKLTLDAALKTLSAGETLLFDGGWAGTAAVGQLLCFTLGANGRVNRLEAFSAQAYGGLDHVYNEALQKRLSTEYSRISLIAKLGDPYRPSYQARFTQDTPVFLRYGTPEAGYQYALVTAGDLPMMTDGSSRLLALGAKDGLAQVALAETPGLPGGLRVCYGLVRGVAKYMGEDNKVYYGLDMWADGQNLRLLTKPSKGGNLCPDEGGDDAALMAPSEAFGYARVVLDYDGAVERIQKIRYSDRAAAGDGWRWVQGVVTRVRDNRTVTLATDFTYADGGIRKGPGFEDSAELYLASKAIAVYSLKGGPRDAFEGASYGTGMPVRLQSGIETSVLGELPEADVSSGQGTVADLLLVNVDGEEVAVAAFVYRQSLPLS